MSRVRVGLVTLAVGLLAVGLLVAPATAGDSPSTIDFEPRESTVAPGETVEMAVVLNSPGSYMHGVAEFELRIEYDSDHVTVTQIESGNWFAQGDANVSTDSSQSFDDDAGVVTYTEMRDPVGNGTVGSATAAVITVEVDEDAPASEASLSAGNSRILLTDGYPQPIAASQVATLSITESTDDSLPSPVIGGIALLGTLVSTHFLLKRRN